MANYSIFGAFSPPIRERFYAALSDYPRCTDSLLAGHRKCPKHVAIKRRYLEFNRENYWIKYLTFDCDSPQAGIAWHDFDLPAPTICVITPQNGHAHLTYELKTPVHLGGNPSQKATYYLQVIKQGYTKALEADDTYGGLLSKNPLSSFWEVFGCDQSYDLDELAEPIREISCDDLINVPLSELFERIKQAQIPLKEKRKPKPVETDPSGSLFVFDNARYYAYEIVRLCKRYRDLYEKIERYIVQLSADFGLSLTAGRIKSDTKSIAQWTWEHRRYFVATSQAFSEIQRERAYKSHESRRSNNEARIQAAFEQAAIEGIKPTQKNISALSGLCLRTIKTHWHQFKHSKRCN